MAGTFVNLSYSQPCVSMFINTLDSCRDVVDFGTRFQKPLHMPFENDANRSDKHVTTFQSDHLDFVFVTEN